MKSKTPISAIGRHDPMRNWPRSTIGFTVMRMADRGERANRRPIGDDVADLILDHLRENPNRCIEVRGRVGAIPIFRFRDGKWQFAAKLGPGGIKAGTFSDERAKALVSGGPRVTFREIDDMGCWEYWPEGKDFDL